MNSRSLLALTSHGNAPYLMAARFARAMGDFSIVIPHYYGHKQVAIMMEEIPEMAGKIFLSKELGELFQPLLLDARNEKSFRDFGTNIARDENPSGAYQIENRTRILLDEGITASSLDGSHHKKFYKNDFSAAINTTLPIRVNLPETFFFFTARMSALYGLAPAGDDTETTRETVSGLQSYAELWRKVEDTFSAEFIPRINAFSYNGQYRDDNMIHTPPFAFKRNEEKTLTQKSVLFVPSGTRTDVEKLLKIAESIPDDYQLLVLGSNKSNQDFTGDRFKYFGARIFSDPNLIGVVSRGGWGTTWECLANNKPAGLVLTSFTEDPEMGHSQKTMEKLGLAAILDGEIGSFIQEDTRAGILAAMDRERAEEMRLFGAFADDGYAYIASKISEMNRL